MAIYLNSSRDRQSSFFKRTASRLPIRILLIWVALMGLLILLCMSCVRTGVEDDCEFPIRLRYSYVYNREDRDLLKEEVPNLTLFLFDLDSHKLVKNAEYEVGELPEDATITLYAPPGHYCLVSWGGAGDRYIPALEKELTEHDIIIETDDDGNVTHRRIHLWHAITDDILVNGKMTPVHEVELIKLTNDVNVTVRSTDGSRLDGTLSEAEITAGNGRHDYSGAIHREPKQVRYMPASDNSQGHISHEFTTLSLHDNDDSNLSVTYGNTELYSGSLTGLLANQPNIDFGLDDTFDIQFEVTPSATDGTASLTVSVNGWKVHDYEINLQ